MIGSVRITAYNRPMNSDPENMTPDESEMRAERRLRGFAKHLMGYIAAMVLLVSINLLMTPDEPWFVLPMVGWGSVLALHVAWVMGLFDRLSGK